MSTKVNKNRFEEEDTHFFTQKCLLFQNFFPNKLSQNEFRVFENISKIFFLALKEKLLRKKRKKNVEEEEEEKKEKNKGKKCPF